MQKTATTQRKKGTTRKEGQNGAPTGPLRKATISQTLGAGHGGIATQKIQKKHALGANVTT
eukprot:5921229-Alexandrium_andersonii.AAC.1